MIKPLGIIIGLLCIVQAAAAGINLTAKSGETWIQWQWDSGLDVNITVDGTENVNGTRLAVSAQNGTYLMNDIRASEKHHIQITNATGGEELGEMEAVTSPAMMTVYSVLGVSILFTVLLMMARDDIRGTICGVLGFISAGYLTWITTSTIDGFRALGLILAVINAGMICLVFYEKYAKKNDSWGLTD